MTMNKTVAPWRSWWTGLTARMWARMAGGEVERRVALAVRALDDARDVLVAGQRGQDRDRYGADRDEVLRDALDAWRTNPLARRIVALTTQYVVGAGVTLSSPHAPTQEFLKAWWGHRLNRMAVRVFEWSDELARAGNLIVLVSTDAAGMSYVRGLPAAHVQEIVTRANDVEQPVAILEKPQWGPEKRGAPAQSEISNQESSIAGEARQWPAYDETSDRPHDDGSWPTVALHYTEQARAGVFQCPPHLALEPGDVIAVADSSYAAAAGPWRVTAIEEHFNTQRARPFYQRVTVRGTM